MTSNIIGISALYHDSACCLLQNGEVKVALQEERLTRIKNDPSLPRFSFRYCLEKMKCSPNDITCIAFYESPEKKFGRQLWSGMLDINRNNLKDVVPQRVAQYIREDLGCEVPIKFVDHHLSHAASSFFFSGFDDAAVLTVDGVGEWATTTYGKGQGHKIDLFEEVHFPDSLGLFYSTITSFLGFEVNEGEYKVMGLAPYGTSKYKDKLYKMISSLEKGQFRLDMKYFDFLKTNRMYSDQLEELLGIPRRVKGVAISQDHMDLAKSLQEVLEEMLLEKVEYLFDKTGAENLCMAGGVALNCVANGRILRQGPFKRLFVAPASNDSGGALGAAAQAYAELFDARPAQRRLEHVYLGPAYDSPSIKLLLDSTPLKYHDFQNSEDALVEEVARQILDGKVIGWFHGRLEFGPRALGGRSILADPRVGDMKDRINKMVKKREGFRPFAPVVLEDKCYDHFDIDHPSPFMLETCQVKSKIGMAAITHVDGSARIQTISEKTNPRFTRLLREFERISECPVILNTSFNVKGEPIICSPVDALQCFLTTEIDTLVLEDFVINRSENDVNKLAAFVNLNRQKNSEGVRHDVYTFI